MNNIMIYALNIYKFNLTKFKLIIIVKVMNLASESTL